MQLKLFDDYEKFGYITDTHFDIKHNFRRDDALASLLNKTDLCYRKFVGSGCKFVIHGGDVFDRHRIYNFDLLRAVRNIIMKYDLPTYFILGQHDASGYNRATLDKSNLGFLRDICDGRLIFIDDYVDVGNYRVYASHVNMDVGDRIKSICNTSDKIGICVAHALLTDQREAFGTISICHIKNPTLKLILSGDLHDGIPLQTMNDLQFYNPGSLARTERTLEREPKAGILQYDGGKFTCEEFYPDCLPPEEVFYLEDMVEPSRESGRDVAEDTFLDTFNQFRNKSGNAFDLLIDIGEAQNINPEVIEIIKLYKDKLDDEV